MLALPEDIQLQILSHCGEADKKAARQASKGWKAAVSQHFRVLRCRAGADVLCDFSAFRGITCLDLRCASSRVTGATLTEVTADGLPCPELSTVSVRRLDDRDVRLLGALPKLRQLDMATVSMRSGGLHHLSGLTQLLQLSLARATVAKKGFRNGLIHLAALAQLQQLNLAGTSVSNRSMQQIAELTQLSHLNLASTLVGDEGIRQLQGLVQIQHLNLSSTQVSGAGLACVARLSKLQELSVAGTGVRKGALQRLAALPQLQQLNAAGVKGRGKPLPDLAVHSGLQQLNLAAARLQEGELRRSLRLSDGPPSLQRLCLTGAVVGRDDLTCLSVLAQLQMLSLAHTGAMDEAVGALRHLRQLQRLSLAGNPVRCLQPLSGLTQLQQLVLAGSWVDAEGLRHLTALILLQELDLRGTEVDASALPHIQHLSALRRLRVAACPGEDALLQAWRPPAMAPCGGQLQQVLDQANSSSSPPAVGVADMDSCVELS